MNNLVKDKYLLAHARCQELRPFVLKKKAWTTNDFFTIMFADITQINGKLVFPIEPVKTFAFDARTETLLAEKLKRLLVVMRDNEGNQAKMMAALKVLFGTAFN